MRLYYYTKLQYGLAAIRDKRIKISLYDSLNDPFDFLGIATSNREQRAALNKIRKELGKMNGIICLSETWKQPLMWGHYAEAHKGVCLGFRVRAGHYEKIKYYKERPSLQSFGKSKVEDLSEADREEISIRKFEQWEYEREWRRVVRLDRSDIVDGNYYLPFGDGMDLDCVLFGSKANIKKSQIDQIAEEYPDLKMAVTRPANTNFDIVINLRETRKIVPKEQQVLNLPVEDRLEIKHMMEKIVYEAVVGALKSATKAVKTNALIRAATTDYPKK